MMSNAQNVYQTNGIKKPLFASAGAAQGNHNLCEDIDLNDIFAEYFINDFDVAGHPPGGNVQGITPASTNLPQTIPTPSAPMILAPTAPAPSISEGKMVISGGGIKTAWHAGALPKINSGQFLTNNQASSATRPSTVAPQPGTLSKLSNQHFLTNNQAPIPSPATVRKPQGPVLISSGGIKTAWHNGTLPVFSNALQQQYSITEHMAKKHKIEGTAPSKINQQAISQPQILSLFKTKSQVPQEQQPALISTGGIKTAWHAGSLPILSNVIQQQFSITEHIAKNKQLEQIAANKTNQQAIRHQAIRPQAIQPQAIQPQAIQPQAIQPQAIQPQAIQPQAIQPQAPPAFTMKSQVQNTISNDSLTNSQVASNNAILSNLSGRLGYSIIGGQLAFPYQQQQQQQQQQHAQQTPVSAPIRTDSKTAQMPGVALPVGIGIRLGGLGGIVHPTQVPTNQGTMVNHTNFQPVQVPSNQGTMVNHTNWTTGNLAHVQHPSQSKFPTPFMQFGVGKGKIQPEIAGLSEAVIAERRLRNREHAKRSRVRKKFLLESLQEQVTRLQRENVELRFIVQEKIPQHAHKLISDCSRQNSPLFTGEGETDLKVNGKEKVKLMNMDFTLMKSLCTGQQNFCLSDPRLPDNPIVYASEGFYALTGYKRDQVLGRNCRFLQGPGTDQRALEVIRTAISKGTDGTVCLLNYKADGTPFWNQFFVAALRDANNNIVNYVGVQCEVEPNNGGTELEEKVNSVMPLQNREEPQSKPLSNTMGKPSNE